MTKIKICGVTLPDDAARVAAAGADFIGLNFWPKSKRYLARERAPMIAAAARAASPVPGSILVVGLFVNALVDDITAVARDVALDAIQLHGNETAEDVMAVSLATQLPIWKAVAIGGPRDIERLDAWQVDALLLDAPTPGHGGSGKDFDWNLARDARRRLPARRIVLAGGLDPGNVAAAIATVDPGAVDGASGVEVAPGIKDAAKIAAFVAAVRDRGRP
ncbi:MAG TPA: phosphoribosylanthranilate isomerase [Kofleriaceae bacterium]